MDLTSPSRFCLFQCHALCERYVITLLLAFTLLVLHNTRIPTIGIHFQVRIIMRELQLGECVIENDYRP